MKLKNKTHCTLPTDNGDFEFHLFTEKTPEKILKEFNQAKYDVASYKPGVYLDILIPEADYEKMDCKNLQSILFLVYIEAKVVFG